MRSPKNYLISIGIDNYQHLESLNGNEAILNKISKLLIEKYGFEYNNTVHLFNEKATKAQFYLALKNLIRTVNDNDNVIVFYSGHGTEENQTNGYFQLFEAENNKPETWFSTNELTANINALRAKNVFVAIKACNSGYIFKNIQNNNAITENIGEGKSRTLFTSSSGNDTTPEKSPFWDFIYECLHKNGRESLDIDSLVGQVKQRMADDFDEILVPRIGKMDGDEGGRMTLFLKTNEEMFWEKALNEDDIEVYSAYLRLFSKNQETAKIRINELTKEKELWKKYAEENISKLEVIKNSSNLKHKDFFYQEYTKLNNFLLELTTTERFQQELNNLYSDNVRKVINDDSYALEIEFDELEAIINNLDTFLRKNNNEKTNELKTVLEKTRLIKEEKELWKSVQERKKKGSRRYEDLRNAYNYYISNTSMRFFETEANSYINAYNLLIEIDKTDDIKAKINKFEFFLNTFNSEKFDHFNRIEKQYLEVKKDFEEEKSKSIENEKIQNQFYELRVLEDLEKINQLLNETENEELKEKMKAYLDEKYISLESDFQNAKNYNTLQSLFGFIDNYKNKEYANDFVSKAKSILSKKEEKEFNAIKNQGECDTFITKWQQYENRFVTLVLQKREDFKVCSILEEIEEETNTEIQRIPLVKEIVGEKSESKVFSAKIEIDKDELMQLRIENERLKSESEININRIIMYFLEWLNDLNSYWKVALVVLTLALFSYFLITFMI